MNAARRPGLIASDGRTWIICSIVHDEAGPERIYVLREEDFLAGRREEALCFDLCGWCEFCAREGLPVRAVVQQ
jgi:hypothetical protein